MFAPQRPWCIEFQTLGQTLGEEGFYMFPTIFEGADSKFDCYQSKLYTRSFF